MANLLTLRTLLRKELRDTQSVQWPLDSELNDILNMAYGLVQKEIRKSYPEAHLFWDYINLVAGNSWYPLPATFAISQVGIKSNVSDTYYAPLKRKLYADIGPQSVTSGSQISTQPANLQSTYYARRGQYIGIFPAPATSIANGIEVVHNPVMSLSLDADVPRIKLPLHMCIVWWAKLIALGDTDEATQMTQTRLGEALSDLALWYDQDGDGADQLQIGGV